MLRHERHSEEFQDQDSPNSLASPPEIRTQIWNTNEKAVINDEQMYDIISLMLIYDFVIWMIKILLAHLSNALLISSSDDKSGEEDKAGKMIIINYILYIIYYKIIFFSSPAVMIKSIGVLRDTARAPQPPTDPPTGHWIRLHCLVQIDQKCQFWAKFGCFWAK